MDQKIILVGSGGCMRELVWQMQEANMQGVIWDILGYVDQMPPEDGKGVYVGGRQIPYLGNDDHLLSQTVPVNAAICVGSARLRKKIADRLSQNPNIRFPSLILNGAKICTDVAMGKGCIISTDVRISTNVRLGAFVFLNIGSRVCHDGQIGDYVTLSPAVTLAGNVYVGSGSEIGMGTNVIQGVRIGSSVVTGAGSIVIHDLDAGGTYVGVPVHRIAAARCGDAVI